MVSQLLQLRANPNGCSTVGMSALGYSRSPEAVQAALSLDFVVGGCGVWKPWFFCFKMVQLDCLKRNFWSSCLDVCCIVVYCCFPIHLDSMVVRVRTHAICLSFIRSLRRSGISRTSSRCELCGPTGWIGPVSCGMLVSERQGPKSSMFESTVNIQRRESESIIRYPHYRVIWYIWCSTLHSVWGLIYIYIPWPSSTIQKTVFIVTPILCFERLYEGFPLLALRSGISNGDHVLRSIMDDVDRRPFWLWGSPTKFGEHVWALA